MTKGNIPQTAPQSTPGTEKGKLIHVKDLCTEFGMDGRTLRAVIRRSGRHAPKVRTAFGVRRLYVWREGSEELATIRALVKHAKEHVEIILSEDDL